MPGFELIGKEEQEAVNQIFETGGVLYRYGWDGKREGIYRVDEFENRFAHRLGVKYALAVSSGTAALHTVLRAMGVGPGDEVITQSYTFIATVEAIVETGATPVITDIDRSLNMDPDDLLEKITSRTKIIIPVHMMGAAARMDEIMDIARERGIKVLEDNAQACGGTYRGKHLGTIGDAGITSFDFGKVLTTGEGGMIYTNDEDIFIHSRQYSDHGHELNPNVPRGEDTRSRSGFNYKMTELQGAVGLAQLDKLDTIIQRQRYNKDKVKKGISDIPDIEFRDVPDPSGDIGDSVVFFLKDSLTAKNFADLWARKGFGTKNLPDAINWHFAGTWDHILPQYPAYSRRGLDEEFRKSDELLRRAIAIPVLFDMDERYLTEIIVSVHDCMDAIRQ